MKTTDFARHLTNYLSIYLPGQRNLSSHTIASYRDTFKLLLTFCRQEKGISPECVTLAHIDDDLVLAFMTWIETSRKCGIATRNQRLAAVHAFFRYVQAETPERLLMHQRILAIPLKKTGKPAVSYLTTEALESVLKQPDRNIRVGRRDLLDRQLRGDLEARHERGFTAKEHARTDADEVPDEKERDAGREGDRGAPGIREEEQSKTSVEHHHPEQ